MKTNKISREINENDKEHKKFMWFNPNVGTYSTREPTAKNPPSVREL